MAIAADPRILQYPLSVERYELMAERGILGEDDKVELLRGVLAEMVPQGDGHSEIIDWLADEFFASARAAGYRVRVQMPMRLWPASMPEPDLAVLPRAPRPWRHPKHVPLAIEVSVTSMATDLGVKAELYAEASIDELWVVVVPTRTVHVHRRPVDGRYTDVTAVTAGTITPLLAGTPAIDVAELFGDVG